MRAEDLTVTWTGRVPGPGGSTDPVHRGWQVSHRDGREWYIYHGPDLAYIRNTRSGQRVTLDGRIGIALRQAVGLL